MKGALEQLNFKGSEDINLSIDPEISFFKSVYKRHSNFSIESIGHNLPKTTRFENTISLKLEKYGELISKMYLEVELPYEENSNAYWTNRIGFNLINKVELFIGDTLVETQYGMYLHVWAELSNSYDKNMILNDLVGTKSKSTEISNGLKANKPHKLIIPLNFFFCQHYSKSLPVISIRNQDIFFKFKFNSKKNCLQKGDIQGEISNITLWIDHIFIEKQEALQFAQNDLQYLIDVSNRYIRLLPSKGNNDISLPIVLPCKEIIWVLKKENKNKNINTDKFTDFTSGNKNDVLTVSFYGNTNFRGWKINLPVGNYTNDQLREKNISFNTLSSIISNGLKIFLYTKDNFKGENIKIKKDTKSLGDFNNKVRSIKIIQMNEQINLFSDINFSINSKNIFSKVNKNFNYFNYYIPYKYHSGNPDFGINCFPFCLYPENISPSGTLNLFNNEKFKLNINTNVKDLRIIIFTRGYNILKINNGNISLEYNN